MISGLKKTAMLFLFFAGQLSFAGNFDGEYNFIDLRCKSKLGDLNIMIRHEKVAGIRSVTENTFEKDGETLLEQTQRQYLVNGMQSETRILISQKPDSSPLTIHDPVVVLYASTKDLNSKKQLTVEIGKGTVKEAINLEIKTEVAQCKLTSQEEKDIDN